MLACLVVLVPALSFAQQGIDTLNTKVPQPANLQADFTYLHQALEETHPGLYRYSLKDEMTRRMDSLYAQLNQPLPYWTCYAMVSSLIGDIRCAHTFMVPTGDMNGFLNQAKIIPFHVRWFTEEKAYVLLNRSPDIPVGRTLGPTGISGLPDDIG
jgi:hypothetical protein